MHDIREKRISPHFSWREFCHSRTAEKRGIDNSIPESLRLNAQQLVKETLEPLRAVCGPLFITSGYRSPKLNKAIGGAKKSAHTEGRAADIVPTAISVRDAWHSLLSSGISYDKAILEFPDSPSGGWIHVQVRRDGKLGRKRNLLAKKVNGKTVYEPYTNQ